VIQVKLAVLLNPKSGAAIASDGEDLARRVAAAFATEGATVDIEVAEGPLLVERAAVAVRRAKLGELDAVAVGGGDGSVSGVAGVLAGTGVPMGIIPLGTLNHFAKDLGLSLGLAEAAASMTRGTVQKVDVAEVNGTVFVNNSSIGVYAHMVVDRDRRRALHGMSKWRAMFWAALRVLRHPPLRRLHIQMEDAVRELRTPFLLVSNNAYDLAPTAARKRQRLDAGILTVNVARRESRASVIWLAVRTLLGIIDTARDLESFQTRSVEIGSKTSRLLVACDGEVRVLRPPLTYRIRPGDLLVLAPPGPLTPTPESASP
jgi:diacylglycerol kinase family enzyme